MTILLLTTFSDARRLYLGGTLLYLYISCIGQAMSALSAFNFRGRQAVFIKTARITCFIIKILLSVDTRHYAFRDRIQ
jgi:hypothetical protein